MLAVLISLAAFTYCGLIGFALLSATRFPEHPLKRLLISPAAGLAVMLVPVLILNRAGFPVRTFATPLCGTLLIIAIALLVRLRPSVARRYGLPICAITVLAVILVGRPFFDFGFSWTSYSNDDMTNYVLSAQRFAAQGYFSAPAVSDVVFNRNATDMFWYAYDLNYERPGSDLILALFSSTVHMSALKLFMSMMLVFHLSFIFATSALLVNRDRRHLVWLFAFCLTCSSMLALGTLYQLAGQTLGMGLLSLVVVLVSASDSKGKPFGLASAIWTTIAFAALCIAYPEVLPFALVATAIIVIHIVRHDVTLIRSFGRYALLTGVGCAVLLNTYLQVVIALSHGRITATTRAIDPANVVFPYFIIPEGLASLWGFSPVAHPVSDPWLSLGIVVGFVLLVMVVISLASLISSDEPLVALAIPIVAVTLFLASKRNDFALFKLAMYLQPTLFGTLVIVFSRMKPALKNTGLVVIASIAVIGLSAETYYVERSRDLPTSKDTTLTEIPHASSANIVGALDDLRQSQKDVQIRLVSDATNTALAKFESTATVGSSLLFWNDMFVNLQGTDNRPPIETADYLARLAYAGQIQEDIYRYRPRLSLDLLDGKHSNVTFVGDTRLRLDGPGTNAGTSVLLSGGLDNILNGSGKLPDRISLKKSADLPNMLFFVDSTIGRRQKRFFATDVPISLFAPEPDYYFPERRMAAIGQYLLFSVAEPRLPVRLVLNITDTLNHDGQSRIPASYVIGITRVPLNVRGRGSGRYFSPSIVPFSNAGGSYLCVDNGPHLFQFHTPRTGLAQLWGTDISLDPRHIVGFARNISAISDADYQKLVRPTSISVLPHDLGNEALEYSGIYEDGWLSEDSYVVLRRPKNSRYLTVRGSIPALGNSSPVAVHVAVAGGRGVSRSVKGGEAFVITVDTSTVAATAAKVSIRFSRTRRLPEPDIRRIAAKLDYVGFNARPPDEALQSVPTPEDVTFRDGWYPVELYDGQTFRWMQESASITSDSDVKSMRIVLAAGPGVTRNTYELSVYDRGGTRLTRDQITERHGLLISSRDRLRFPLKFRVRGGGKRIPNDNRVLNVRLFSLSVTR